MGKKKQGHKRKSSHRGHGGAASSSHMEQSPGSRGGSRRASLGGPNSLAVHDRSGPDLPASLPSPALGRASGTHGNAAALLGVAEGHDADAELQQASAPGLLGTHGGDPPAILRHLARASSSTNWFGPARSAGLYADAYDELLEGLTGADLRTATLVVQALRSPEVGRALSCLGPGPVTHGSCVRSLAGALETA
mgnify:CR=1 FL=1